MVTTTTLTTAASSFNVGVQHVQFHVRTSTPDSGDVKDGWGEWRVERAGAFVHRANGTMGFGWLGQDGDVVHARYVDGARVAGAWTTYTFVVQDASNYDDEQYVDDVLGDDGNDGLSPGAGNAVATIAQALTNLPAPSAGEEQVIYLRAGQTHTHNSTIAGSSTNYRLTITSYDSGGRPSISTNTTLLQPGMARAYVVDGVDASGDGSGNDRFWNGDRSDAGVATREAYDLIVRDSDLSIFQSFIEADDADFDLTDRNGGTHSWDFLAFENVGFDDLRSPGGTGWFFFGSAPIQYMLVRNCTLGDSEYQMSRIVGWSHLYWEDVTVDNGTSAGGQVRFFGGQGASSEDAVHSCDFQRCVLKADGDSLGLKVEHASGQDSFFRNVRWVNSVVIAGRAEFRANDFAGDESCDIDGWDWWNCTFTEEPSIGISTNASAPAKLRRMTFRNCGLSQSDSASGGNILQLGQTGDKANVVDGALYSTGNYGYIQASGAVNTMSAYQAKLYDDSTELSAKFSESDNNHWCKVDGSGTLEWIDVDVTDRNLSEWQDDTTFDDNSSVNASTSPPFTDDGSTDEKDTDLTWTADSGPGSGTGYAGAAYPYDALDKVRHATTPDAGPYEFGATENPDDPPLVGGGGARIRLIT